MTLPMFPKPGQVQKRTPAYKIIGGRLICNLKTTAGLALYKRLRDWMARRQNGFCALAPAHRIHNASFDHEIPRGMGSAFRDDSIYKRDARGRLRRHNAAVCYQCNGAKGSRRIPYLLQNIPYRKRR